MAKLKQLTTNIAEKMLNIILRKKPFSSIGLDINSQYIRILGITTSDSCYKITHFFKNELPKEAVIRDEIKNIKLVENELKKIRKTCKKIKKVAISISNHLIFNKKIAINRQLNEIEREVFIQHNLKKQFPEINESLNFDFNTTIDPPQKETDKNEINLWVTATQSKHIKNKINIIKASGLTPIIVDIDHYALARAAISLGSNKNNHDLIGLLNIERNTLNFIVINAQQIIYSKNKFFNLKENQDSLITIMLQLLIFFTTSIPNKKLNKLLISGSLEKKESIAEQIETVTNIKTQIASITEELEVSNHLDKDEFFNISQEFLLCHGLAIHNHWKHIK